MDTFFQIIDLPVKTLCVAGSVMMFAAFGYAVTHTGEQDDADRRCREHQVNTDTGDKPLIKRPRPIDHRLPKGYWDGADLVGPDHNTDAEHWNAA